MRKIRGGIRKGRGIMEERDGGTLDRKENKGKALNQERIKKMREKTREREDAERREGMRRKWHV